MADIKTKDVIRGTIKTLDKAAIASDRMKSSYTKTKENVESAYSVDEGSPSEYASNRVSRNMEAAVREGSHQFNVIGRKSFEETKANFIKSREITKYVSGVKSKETVATETVGKPIIKGTEKTAIKSVETVKRNVIHAKMQQAVMQKKLAKKTAQRSYQTARKAANTARRTAVVFGKAAKKAVLGMKALISAIIAGGWIAVIVIVICCLFGAALYFFGGSGTNYTPVSPEVEAYSSTISKYADENKISEYTELIKAVMMQESAGKGEDPMDSGGKNPEESIKKGVQKLAGLIKKTGCESPLDMASIREVLKGYIDGKDDEAYLTGVLQYYPYGNFSDEIVILGDGTFGLPLQGMKQGHITSHFGHRNSPGGIGSTNHKGLDIGFPTGTKVYACEAGKVIYAGWSGGFGKLVVIDHGNGMQTYYAHLSRINTAKGMKVVRGQNIGEVGSTGNSTGPHLHLGVMVNGSFVDPEKFLAIPK